MKNIKFKIEKDKLFTEDGQVYQLTLISEDKAEPTKTAEHKKEPILTTKDGVEIYDENQSLIGISKDCKVRCNAWAEVAKGQDYVWFLDAKEMEKYIEENKPMYSRKQISECLDLFDISKITKQQIIKMLDL